MKKAASHEKGRRMADSGWTALAVVLSAILVLSVSGYSAWIVASAYLGLEGAVANFTNGEEIPLPEPQKISALLVLAPDCEECGGHAQAISAINQSASLSYSEVAHDSQAGRDAIREYGIEKLPAVIFIAEDGEPGAVSSLVPLARKTGDAYVLESAGPTYYSVAEARVAGRVFISVVTVGECAECLPPDLFSAQLSNAGVSIAGMEQHEYGSDEASALISEYALEKLPAMVFSRDLGMYREMLGPEAFDYAFSKEADGSYVFRSYNFPYIEAETGRARGHVDIVLIDDESCAPCYDPLMHESAIMAYGVAVNSTTIYDMRSPEGSALVEKYGIKQVPTMLVSQEAGIYPSLMEIWAEVGSVEPDGWLVFRDISMLGGNYRDLESGAIVIVDEGG